MSEWISHNLGELIEVQNGYAFKSKDFDDFNGTPVIKIKNVASGELRMDDIKYYPLTIAGLERFVISKNDILIALTGSHVNQPSSIVGKVARYTNDEISLLNQRVGKIYSLDEKETNENYIYWFFKQWEVTLELALNAGGSANQANISGELIKTLELELPPLPEQHAIASVLSSLDDKIDLLHRQNKTLESMAETLFRQWFVEEAEEGWGEGTLGDIAKNARNTAKVGEFDSNCKYVALEHIERRNIALKRYSAGSDVSSNKYYFEVGDILFGKLRPYFHKVCFTSFSGICSTDILVIRPKNSDWFLFCLFAFFQNEVIDYANLGSSGTRMPRTDWKTLALYPIAIPDIDAVKRFNEIVSLSLNKIQANIQQIRTLTHLRDTLLPKLMSGEVRVQLTRGETAT